MFKGLLAVALVCAVGCGSSSSGGTEAAKACTPGAQVSCACPGGVTGAQACHDDGSGYGACVCGAGAAGGASGAGGAAGGAGAAGAPADIGTCNGGIPDCKPDGATCHCSFYGGKDAMGNDITAHGVQHCAGGFWSACQ